MDNIDVWDKKTWCVPKIVQNGSGTTQMWDVALFGTLYTLPFSLTRNLYELSYASIHKTFHTWDHCQTHPSSAHNMSPSWQKLSAISTTCSFLSFVYNGLFHKNLGKLAPET